MIDRSPKKSDKEVLSELERQLPNLPLGTIIEFHERFLYHYLILETIAERMIGKFEFTAVIQISRQNENGFFSNASHQIMI